MKRAFQVLMSLIFSAVLLLALFRQFDLWQTVVAVRKAHPRPFILGIILMIGAYLLRGARWQLWESTLTYWDSLRLVLIGFMGNNVLPARLGDVLRAHCAATKTGEYRGRMAVLGSIVVERTLDGLILALIGIISLGLVSDVHLKFSLLVISIAFIGLAAALILSIRVHRSIRSLIAAANLKFPGHVTTFACRKANQFLDGFLPLTKLSRLACAIMVTGLIWGVEAASYCSIGFSVWDSMRVGVALLFLVAVNFASLIPFTIGGIGAIEAVAVPFLIAAGVPPYAALAMILLQHMCQYVFTTITGAVLYLAGRFYRPPVAAKVAAVLPKTETVRSSRIIEETRSDLRLLSQLLELRPAPPDVIDLSIVIPAYNEQVRLPRTVLETIRWCVANKLNFEIVIADDGSSDETLALARLFETSEARVRVLACPHTGKGATVRMGMLNARGQFILFMDADGATPLTEISKLLAALNKGHDIAIGSRIAQQTGEIQVKTPMHRRFIGRIFAFFVNLFAVDGIADTQCGFKMFRRDAALEIFSRQKTVGFAFDVEILLLARILSLSIAEIPVNWIAQPGSKVNLVRDSIRMLWDISRIRWLHRNAVHDVISFVPHRRPDPKRLSEAGLAKD